MSVRPLSFLVPCLLFVGTFSANAQIITWGTVNNMAGPGDISQNGTFIDAVAANTINGDSPTIGDSTFTDLSSQIGNPSNLNPNSPPSYLLTDGTISITADNLANFGIFNTTDAAYQDAISNSAYIGNSSEVGTVSFSGLTAGDSYQVEVWCFYSDNRFNPVLSGANSPTLVNGTGQYVLGTFEASSSTFSFDYSAASGEAGALINAVEIREVPEPSTWLLMGLGAVIVGWRLYRRQLA